MRRVLGQLINGLLKRVGLKLAELDEQTFDYRKYIDLIKEVQGCFSELIFPYRLPSCENRVELMAKLLGTQVSEAMYLLKFLHESLEFEGDICEFGVAQGATSALLANEIRLTKKNLWLFDSFEGLPKPSEKDLLIDDIFNLGSIDKYEGTMCCQVDEVKSRLDEISFPLERAKIVPGFIEKTINHANLPDKVCFAYVDFDFYNPTSVVLEYLNKHLSVGGFTIVDDYGFFSSGVKKAVDEFLSRHQEVYEFLLPYGFAGHFCILHRKPLAKDATTVRR